jgi:Leucine-rich repeat (LRR) protein
MKNKLLITKLLILSLLIVFYASNGYAQKDKKTNTKSEKNEADPIAQYQKQAEDLISFMEGTLNAIGSEYTPVREKQIMINESYSKIFLDDKVQVEDDLDENREIYTYKNVQAYMQDVDFFFKNVTFTFKIQNVENFKNNDGDIVFKFKTSRYLKGIGLENDSVNSIIDRYIEINYIENDQSLKIVSMYTTKLNEAEETMSWWTALSPDWKKILLEKNSISEPIDQNKLKTILRTTELNISNNPAIKNLDPLTKIARLKRLDCSNTGINDLYPIRSLNKLEVVNCSNTGIKSIEPLQYASNLTDLFIDNTGVEDITTVENFPNLKKLSFESTGVSDIEAIIECSQLEDLRMSGTKVESLAVLKELSELKILRINSLAVATLDGIENHKKMEQISFAATKITDISILSTFSNLQVVYFNNTGVNTLEPLKKNKKLEKIYCDNSGIDASKAANFNAVMPNCLVMYNSDILKKWWEEMSPEWKTLFFDELKTENPNSEQLHKLSLAKDLNLSGKASISTLEPASKFSHLNSIDISGTSITDLSPLKNLVDLEKINCSNTKVAKVDDLANLKRLVSIDLSKTEVKDIAPLANCDNLETITADNTGISKLSDLNKLKRLKKIFADNTSLTKEAVFEFNDINTSCLVIYRTEELKKWWNLVDDEWKKIFNRYVGFNDKITGEQLHQITVLKEIDVKEQTGIRGLKPLEMLDYLEVLKFADTRIYELDALKNLKNLKELVCPRNPISSLDAIASLKKLEVLDCSNTLISKLDPIKDSKALTVLKVSGTKVRWLKSLSQLNALVHLDLSGSKVIFIKPIINLASLKVLKCYNTKIPGFFIKKFKENNPDCDVVN